ncbi:hypothetical protein D3C73_1032340 [compost metagenome]
MRKISDKLIKLHHKRIRHRHRFTINLIGLFIDPNIVTETLAHLLNTVQTFDERSHDRNLGIFSVLFLKRPAHQQIKFLICATELDITFKRYRIHPLH